MNWISLSREVHWGKSLIFYSIHVHVIIYFVKCILIAVICIKALTDCHRHRCATILVKCRWQYLIFFLLTAQRPVYMNLNNCKQHVVLPRSACCYSEILFPRTCKNQPQTLIVYEYSYENRHFFYYQIIDITYTSSIFIKNCKFFYKLLNLPNEV